MIGITKHEELYGDGWFSNRMFYEIVYALEDKMKHPEYDEVIILTLDYDEQQVTAIRQYDYDEEVA